MRTSILSAASALALLTAAPAALAQPAEILTTYANIAAAGYEDSLSSARTLREAVGALVERPDDVTLTAAREAWLAARVPYMQTEAFRFGNPIVDEWEGRVNAWPLDEGLIDYVDASYGTQSDTNEFYAVNVVGNAEIASGGETLDLTAITPETIRELHEVGGIEANVATGYHAIEFLLWGQDLNGTEAGAGSRAASDFNPADCTGGNCERRIQYLVAASDLLVSDLEEMAAAWTPEGEARKAVTAGDPKAGLTAMLTGLGSLSYGEMAGERMKLGLLLNDPEEEHDCFSDNTHNSHFYDVLGIANVYRGRYERPDRSVIEGANLADLVAETDLALAAEMQSKLDATLAAFTTLKERAETVERYDQMIGEGNAEGNAVVQAAIDSLIDQTRTIERVIAALDLSGVTIEGSDSLDAPEAVFQ